MSSPTPLKFLMPGWFATVMGLAGLALAWNAAQALLGDMAGALSLVMGVVAFGVFGVLAVASLLRWQRHAAALEEDLKHPVRHAFIAAVPVSLLLLATVGVALGGGRGPLAPVWQVLWWAGSLGQLWATLWVLGRWLAPAVATPAAQGPASPWLAVTPVLLIPIVGNVVVPLAGLPLGHGLWSAAQFGIGAFLWPIVLALLLVRRLAHSPLPERILSAWFITVAPPAVIGLVLLQMQAAPALVLALWGVALFFLAWVAPLLRRIAAQAFSVAFWGLSFPLAALTTLTLRLADPAAGAGGAVVPQMLAVLLLAVSSIVILWLCFATVRGLRDGSLLAPEPVAAIQPA